MNECDIRVGDIVLSTQGRDKGNYFLVVEANDGFVFLVDGGMRKLAQPKKKNVKHVSHSGKASTQSQRNCFPNKKSSIAK